MIGYKSARVCCLHDESQTVVWFMTRDSFQPVCFVPLVACYHHNLRHPLAPFIRGRKNMFFSSTFLLVIPVLTPFQAITSLRLCGLPFVLITTFILLPSGTVPVL